MRAATTPRPGTVNCELGFNNIYIRNTQPYPPERPPPFIPIVGAPSYRRPRHPARRRCGDGCQGRSAGGLGRGGGSGPMAPERQHKVRSPIRRIVVVPRADMHRAANVYIPGAGAGATGGAIDSAAGSVKRCRETETRDRGPGRDPGNAGNSGPLPGGYGHGAARNRRSPFSLTQWCSEPWAAIESGRRRNTHPVAGAGPGSQSGAMMAGDCRVQ